MPKDLFNHARTFEDGMTKVHYQEDQEELYRLCDGMMNTLIDTDGGIKCAASDLIPRDILDQFRPDKDHFLIHCVAMGDTETYGPNKNADGWPKEALARRHQTFVTNGHFFREHRNRDPKQKIGDIKYAAYDPKGMRRVELLMWGNKEAAAKEYAKAKAGKELSFSMSARVPNDRCNCCGNIAKSAAVYCKCLKETPLQYVKEFKKYAFAHNDEPTFFDNSAVENPADRVARYLDYKFHDEDMRKAASSQSMVIKGTDWAEFEGVLLPSAAAFDGNRALLLTKLAAAERWMVDAPQDNSIKSAFMRETAPYSSYESASDAELELFRSVRPGTLFRELAKRACVMNFPTFAAYATGKSVDEVLEDPVFLKAGRSHLYNVFHSLSNEEATNFSDMFVADSAFSSSCDDGQSNLVRVLEKSAKQKFSLAYEDVARRTSSAILSEAETSGIGVDSARFFELKEKSASASDQEARVLAEAYGNYQVNALADIQSLCGASTVGDQEIDLLVSCNNTLIFR